MLFPGEIPYFYTIYMGYSRVMSLTMRLRSVWLYTLCALVAACEQVHAADITGRVDMSRTGSRATMERPADPGGLAASLDTLSARVFLRGPEMVTTRRSGPLTIQRNIRDGVLVPPFDIVRLGDRVAITNQDAVPRLAIIFENDRTHLLGPILPAGTASIRVSRFGAVELSTDAPGAVRSLLFVAENPFVARVGPDGRFVMGGVPPGDYQLIVWRPDGFMGDRFLRLTYADSLVDAGKVGRP